MILLQRVIMMTRKTVEFNIVVMEMAATEMQVQILMEAMNPLTALEK